MLSEADLKAIKQRADSGYGLPNRYSVDGEMRVVQSDVLDLIAEVVRLRVESEWWQKIARQRDEADAEYDRLKDKLSRLQNSEASQ